MLDPRLLRSLKVLACHRGFARSSVLLESLGCTNANMHHVMRKMIGLGYVERQLYTGNGSRGVCYEYRLTDSGRDIIHQAETKTIKAEKSTAAQPPATDSERMVHRAIRTQPNSVFDLARVIAS